MPLEGGGGIEYNGLRPITARLYSRPPYSYYFLFYFIPSCSPDFSDYFTLLFVFPSYVVVERSVLFLFHYFVCRVSNILYPMRRSVLVGTAYSTYVLCRRVIQVAELNAYIKPLFPPHFQIVFLFLSSLGI